MKRILILIFILTGFLSCKKEPPAPLPTADFYINNSECLSPCYLYFFNQSKNEVSYRWDFDNATFSNNANDSSLYFGTGIYNITLSVWNADNVKDSVTKSVTIY